MTLNKIASLALCVAALSLMSACSETRYAAHLAKQIPMPGDPSQNVGAFKVGTPYKIQGRVYTPQEQYSHVETGVASWYGPGFHGKKTANGELFDQTELTAAHRTLQLPSIIRVTNLDNGRSAILRVNDRGPFARDRILDVSEQAATVLGFKNNGTARIKLEVLGDASRQVANIARSGQSTRGYEVALNQNKNFSIASAPVIPTPKPITVPQTQVAMAQALPDAAPVPLVKPMPVQAEPLGVTRAAYQPTSSYVAQNAVTQSNIANLGTGKIYVQAGSFAQEQNALSLSSQLATYGPSKVYMTRVNNQPYFRVRLGPYDDKAQASEILTALNQSGNKNAVIVVD